MSTYETVNSSWMQTTEEEKSEIDFEGNSMKRVTSCKMLIDYYGTFITMCVNLTHVVVVIIVSVAKCARNGRNLRIHMPAHVCHYFRRDDFKVANPPIVSFAFVFFIFFFVFFSFDQVCIWFQVQTKCFTHNISARVGLACKTKIFHLYFCASAFHHTIQQMRDVI